MLLDLQTFTHGATPTPTGYSDQWFYLEGERLKKKRAAALAVALLLEDDALLALLT